MLTLCVFIVATDCAEGYRKEKNLQSSANLWQKFIEAYPQKKSDQIKYFP